ncbi:probable protein phosphatase 2C 8 isoform X2 [Magnolia sinica]|uniref:probable protein phosphatase 2C 8 isoform X2 n=1 Tax=Magnolia sinica TaxID=86752 RepID=UPI0026585BA8|nr:probable protein phosphatase 2C 8 isoform X2 [Magnolia sinica]
MASICGKWQVKVQNIRLAVTPLLSRISCMNERSSSSSSSYQPKPVDMEMSNSALRAKSAREHRLKVRRLKIAGTIKNQKSDGQGGSPGPKRRREENVHLQPMIPASSSSLLVEAINGRDYRITVGPGANSNDNDQLPSHGGTSVCGRRREMEDTLTLAPHFIGPDHDFFGVYDGHGGSAVAEACAARLHHLLLFEMQRRWAHCGSMRWEEVMEACFLKMDNEVRAQVVEDEEMMVGSTAVVAVVGPRYLIVANCGDSRAVLSRGRQVIPLSNDHKPNRPDELERIEAAGGRVICWDGPRVLGVLATSRSIGGPPHYCSPASSGWYVHRVDRPCL